MIFKKSGFIAIETIIVTAVVAYLGVYSLNVFQDSGAIAIDETVASVNTIMETPHHESGDDYTEGGNGENEGELPGAEEPEEPEDGENNQIIANWVSIGKSYKIGDIVLYKGKEYRCTLPHITAGILTLPPNYSILFWKRV